MHARRCLSFFWKDSKTSPRKNYFRSAGHFVRQAFNALPDILNPCQTFFSVDDRGILFSLAGHFPCIEPCRTKCPAMLETLLDISRSLPDMSGMSGIFREDCIPKSTFDFFRFSEHILVYNIDDDIPTIKSAVFKCAFFTLLWLLTSYCYARAVDLKPTLDVVALFGSHSGFVYLLSWTVLRQQFLPMRVWYIYNL